MNGAAWYNFESNQFCCQIIYTSVSNIKGLFIKPRALAQPLAELHPLKYMCVCKSCFANPVTYECMYEKQKY